MLHQFMLLFFFGTSLAASPMSSKNLTISSEENKPKTYSKAYYEDGSLKSEGWEIDNIKMGYWKFYYADGTLHSKGSYHNNQKDGYWFYYAKDASLLREGHYAMGQAENWWIMYDIDTASMLKVQFENNRKNGFGLRYQNKKLVCAEKYKDDLKIGQWKSIMAFRRDNPNASF